MGFGIESFVAFKLFDERVPEFSKKIKGLNVGIGSQEFDTKLSRCNHFISDYLPYMRANEDGVMKGPLNELSDAWGSSGYIAYDIDGRFGARPVDLNVERVPEQLKNSASLILNLGTSEHVFNQENIWRFMYDHTDVGGYIYSVLPYCDYIDHGLYTYSPAFFWSLAYYNRLRICFIGLSPNKNKNLLVDLSHASAINGRKANIICLLEKTTNKGFEIPMQYNNPMVFDESFKHLDSRSDVSETVTDSSFGSFNIDLETSVITSISRSKIKKECFMSKPTQPISLFQKISVKLFRS